MAMQIKLFVVVVVVVVARAETSARLLKQILLKSNCRLHGEGFSPGRNSARADNPSPVCSNRARIFSPGKRARKI